VKLENYYSPWELERAIRRFVEHYNHPCWLLHSSASYAAFW
jgi:hypothetical protein